MKYRQLVIRLTLFIAAIAASHIASAQSMPTATQQFQLSAFAAGTGTFTKFEGGKNLGITAGVDLTYLGFRLFRPSVEVRGTYPIHDGTIDSQKNFLVGPKVEYPLGRIHPYADFFVGRGEITYLGVGYIIAPLEFLSSNTIVYSPGVGVDYDLTHHLAVKADVQFQHWNIPFTPPSSFNPSTINPVAVSFGGVYTFDFNPRHHHGR